MPIQYFLTRTGDKIEVEETTLKLLNFVSEFYNFLLELAYKFEGLLREYPLVVLPVTVAVTLMLAAVLFMLIRSRFDSRRQAAPEVEIKSEALTESGAGEASAAALQAGAGAPAPSVFQSVVEAAPTTGQKPFESEEAPAVVAGGAVEAPPAATGEGVDAGEEPPPAMVGGSFEPPPAAEPSEQVTETAAPVLETPPEPAPEVEEEPETKEGLFSRLRAGLSKTQTGMLGKLDDLLAIKTQIDDELWEGFEEALITADLGVGTTMKLRAEIEKSIMKTSKVDPRDIKDALKAGILGILSAAESEPIKLDKKPFVILVAGVNGVGKTTTIGKLAHMFGKDGKRVMVAAADTFRAAAVEQLEVWSDRVGSDFLRGQTGADPSAVAFDAIKASVARDTDVLIVDTAGRLHTKLNLMNELKKMRRVMGRELEGAPHETLLVLDATTGQNAIQQAKLFKDAIDVTGIVLTKLDGTAKGGVIVAIAGELNIPVKFIGIGESLGDLRRFEAGVFIEALFATGNETIH
ncbi:MAG: signal recognition particle-docking protein FtsY [Thermodesulfobacteriota bacterium]